MEDHQPKEPKTAETAVPLHNGVLPPAVQTFNDQNQKNVRARIINVFDIIERDPLIPGNANGNAKQENKFDDADDNLRDFPLPHRKFDTEKSPKLLHSDLYINLQKTPLTDEYDQNTPEVFFTTKEITKPPKSKENEKLFFTPSESYEKMSIRKHGTNSPCYAGKNMVSSNNNNVPAAQQIAENHPTAPEGQLEQISFRTPQNISPNFTVNSHGLQSPVSAATPCSLRSPASSGGSSSKTAFQFKTPASVTFPWRNPATPFGLQTPKYASDLEQTDAAAISQKPDPLTPATSAPELFVTSAYPETPVTPTVHELDFIKLNLLGKGAHGSVYKAKMGDGSLVAVKKMKNSYPRGHGETKDTALQTLNKEMHILKQLNHPNLVKYYGNFNSQTRDNPCIVLQLLDNDLVTILRSNTNPYNCAEIKCIMAQILSGLEFLHVRKIIHRDLKPENVLVGKNGKVKICDFGISRQAQDDDGGEYTLSVFPNSYRAPEIRAQTAYSTKADIWACGCLLCDIVFGRSLFTEKADVDIGSLTPVQALASVYSILEGDPIQDAEDYIHRLKNGLPIGTQDTHSLQYVVDRDKKNHLLSNCGVDFLNQLLSRDPIQRLSATDALKHPWFSEEPLPVNRKQLPIYERD